MEPRGYTCFTEVEPLIIQMQRDAEGLWVMHLLDRRAACKVVMPPSEFGLHAAKEKALVSAEYYMRKYGGDPSWARPAAANWLEFTPKPVIWET
jgi:hypothetical protein